MFGLTRPCNQVCMYMIWRLLSEKIDTQSPDKYQILFETFSSL